MKNISKKNKNKEINVKTIKIKDILNFETICNSVCTYISYYKKRNDNLEKLLMNLNINEDKISEKIYVTFKRKKKLYKKPIYFFLTNKMKENIKINYEEENQFFADWTYYAVPRINHHFCCLY